MGKKAIELGLLSGSSKCGWHLRTLFDDILQEHQLGLQAVVITEL
jgi:hypothetical protein